MEETGARVTVGFLVAGLRVLLALDGVAAVTAVVVIVG